MNISHAYLFDKFILGFSDRELSLLADVFLYVYSIWRKNNNNNNWSRHWMKVVSVLTRQVYHFVFDDISPPHPRVSCSLQVPSKSQSHFSQACGVYLASDGIYWSTKTNTFTSHTRIPPVWSTLFQFFQDIRMILIGISIVGLISFLIHPSQSFDCRRFLDGILEKRDERLDLRAQIRTQCRRLVYLYHPLRVLSFVAYHGSAFSLVWFLSKVRPSKQRRSKSRSSSGSISCEVRAGWPLFGLANRRG